MEQEYNLWKLFLAGNTTAFETIMNQHFRHLFSYGMKFCDDNELVKDTIQELFIRLWDKKSNLSPDVNIRAYLTASLRRSLYRKIQTQSKFENYDDVEDFMDLFDLEISVEDSLIKKEHSINLGYKIAQNLAALPGRQKEVVYLKFFEELSRDQIAEIMGINQQTVSNLLQMALQRLRMQLIQKVPIG